MLDQGHGLIVVMTNDKLFCIIIDKRKSSFFSEINYPTMATNFNGYTNSRGSPRMENNMSPAENGQPTKAGVRPDGFPVLPPIRKPDKSKVDPYANSKLMKFRLANHKKDLLMKIL